jgi:hypothetical protein
VPPAAPTPVPAAAAPAEPPVADTTPKQPTETKNISSEEIERSEVDKIAAELKHQLEGDQTKAAEKKPAKTEHEIDLKPGKDDTIFIDNEGTFHLADQVSKSDTSN